MNEITIRNFSGQIIGYVKTLPNGDKEVRNFYKQIMGYYRKSRNVTTDFYGRILYQGDMSTALLNG